MNAKEVRYIQETVECEGFHYTFYHYSDFKEIQDEEFHKLRKDYLKGYKELSKYIDAN